jgi:flavin reductase (DIM6/NTAB) family NADH-FMN oxidoreductase RutF
MHIISYVTPISMQPKQYIVGIYHGTKTLELVEKKPVFILQLLDEKQSNLIPLLGKQSGHTINKLERLRKRKLLAEWNGFPILKEALSVIQLKISATLEGGDHKVFLCDVMAYKNFNEGTPLTLDYLREKKIIRG